MAAKPPIVDTKVGRRTRVLRPAPHRSGTVTGARVVLLFTNGGVEVASAAQVAARLGMEEGYTRRVLNRLTAAQVLTRKLVPASGTPDVNIYRLSRTPPVGLPLPADAVQVALSGAVASDDDSK
jgi:hypothetical protein